MRSIITFFTEKQESKHDKVAEEAYSTALMSLCKSRNLHTAEIKERYLRPLLVETLKQLLAYFRKNTHLVGHDGDEKLLANLESQLHTQEFDPNIVETLRINLNNIRPGFFNRGQVYPAFSKILHELPCFQAKSLWCSEVRHTTQLEVDVVGLMEKTAILSHTQHQSAEFRNEDDYAALQDVKSVLMTSSPEKDKKCKESVQQTQNPDKCPTTTDSFVLTSSSLVSRGSAKNEKRSRDDQGDTSLQKITGLFSSLFKMPSDRVQKSKEKTGKTTMGFTLRDS